MITNPVMQTFTLLYKDRFNEIGMSATDASVIINVNYAFGMGLGLIHGAVLKRFGYRRVAIVASIVNAIGVGLTSFANSFIHFLITYGILNSLGASFFQPSFSLALNSYFKKKRGKAMGYSMTLTGIGPIIMPLVISKMMSAYGVQGTGLILGALSLHSLVGAFLLQPIKWHMKRKEEDPVEDVEEGQEDEDLKSLLTKEHIIGVGRISGPSKEFESTRAIITSGASPGLDHESSNDLHKQRVVWPYSFRWF
ncbi:unnamed protein product [Timema podura]|uniref:Major facilitator superfamily (MFS) profile domain-containing protein n=1 Tax=Timema podura TaxID=61482 RepID=A0ABN7PD96_TIMPD|nr:unnamed protein product [Timema podura]